MTMHRTTIRYNRNRKQLTIVVVNYITIMRSRFPTSFITTIHISALRAGFCHGRSFKGAIINITEVENLTRARYREIIEQC